MLPWSADGNREDLGADKRTVHTSLGCSTRAHLFCSFAFALLPLVVVKRTLRVSAPLLHPAVCAQRRPCWELTHAGGSTNGSENLVPQAALLARRASAWSSRTRAPQGWSSGAPLRLSLMHALIDGCDFCKFSFFFLCFGTNAASAGAAAAFSRRPRLALALQRPPCRRCCGSCCDGWCCCSVPFCATCFLRGAAQRSALCRCRTQRSRRCGPAGPAALRCFSQDKKKHSPLLLLGGDAFHPPDALHSPESLLLGGDAVVMLFFLAPPPQWNPLWLPLWA
jgi:hypothetical protein